MFEVLLESHDDVQTLARFLAERPTNLILSEISRNEFTINLFNDYNSSLIKPQFALETYSRVYELLPTVGYLILNARPASIIPIGPETKLYEQDYVRKSNIEIINNIKSLVEPSVNASLVIGISHKGLLSELTHYCLRVF